MAVLFRESFASETPTTLVQDCTPETGAGISRHSLFTAGSARVGADGKLYGDTYDENIIAISDTDNPSTDCKTIVEFEILSNTMGGSLSALGRVQNGQYTYHDIGYTGSALRLISAHDGQFVPLSSIAMSLAIGGHRLTYDPVGPKVNIQLQRLSDGHYRTAAGAYQAGAANIISEIDRYITQPGKSGIRVPFQPTALDGIKITKWEVQGEATGHVAGGMTVLNVADTWAEFQGFPANGPDMVGPITYGLYRRTISGGAATFMGTVSDPSRIIATGLTRSTSYYFFLRATDTGNSNLTADSAEVAVTTNALPPLGLVVSVINSWPRNWEEADKNGFVELLRNRFAGDLVFYNLAENGRTWSDYNTPDRRAQVNAYLSETGYRHYILLAFEHINQLFAAASAQAARDASIAYTDTMRAAGWKVIGHTIPDAADGGGSSAVTRADLNTLLIADNVAGHFDAFARLDTDPAFDDNTDQTYYQANANHLNAAGHIELADLYEPILEALIADTTAPTISAAQVVTSGAGLVTRVTLSEPVTGAGSVGNWVIKADAIPRAISAVAIAADDPAVVEITHSIIYSGQTVTLDFDGAANAVQDRHGNDLAAVSNRAVTNNSTEEEPSGGGGGSGGGSGTQYLTMPITLTAEGQDDEGRLDLYEGDTGPGIVVRARDAAGKPIDLTGATMTAYIGDGTTSVAGEGTAILLNAELGYIKYLPGEDDFADAGDLSLYFRAVTDSQAMTLGPLSLRIRERR